MFSQASDGSQWGQGGGCLGTGCLLTEGGGGGGFLLKGGGKAGPPSS